MCNPHGCKTCKSRWDHNFVWTPQSNQDLCVTQSQPCLQWCVVQGRERKEGEQTVIEGQVTVAAPVSEEASDCLIIPHKAGGDASLWPSQAGPAFHQALLRQSWYPIKVYLPVLLSGSPDKLSLWLLITRPILSGVCQWQSTVRTQRWTGLLGCLSSQPDLGSLCLFLQSSISVTALVAWSLCRPCQLARVNFCLLVHSGIEDIHPQLMTRKE